MQQGGGPLRGPPPCFSTFQPAVKSRPVFYVCTPPALIRACVLAGGAGTGTGPTGGTGAGASGAGAGAATTASQDTAEQVFQLQDVAFRLADVHVLVEIGNG